MKFVYPQLSLKKSQDLAFFRLGGPGLANCLIISARAYLKAKDLGCEMLRPTWERLSIGQWLRGERDKRFYHGLFKEESVWRTLRKLWIVHAQRKMLVEEGIGNFFGDLNNRHDEVMEWFWGAIQLSSLKNVPPQLDGVIAVHVRLGDFPAHYRVPCSWYRDVVNNVRKKVGRDCEVQIFSDGKDEELFELLHLPNTRRVCYGNALADMVAISRCSMLIAGKHSTFSAWGAYMGCVPSIFYEISYGNITKDGASEICLGDSVEIPEHFSKVIQSKFA